MLGTGRLNIFKALSAGVFPSLYVSDVNYLNDTDEDGVFNPGEQVKVKLVIGNEIMPSSGYFPAFCKIFVGEFLENIFTDMRKLPEHVLHDPRLLGYC